MLYIQQTACISPMFSDEAAERVNIVRMPGNRMTVKEPAYPGIPGNLLRRMGKAGRMGTGVCLPLLQKAQGPVSGIIIGTANGGTEDGFRFLQQMIDYREELLSPGGFVQSTANGLAAQLSLMQGIRGYNATHVHRGLAFEQALLDAMMLSAEDRNAAYLVAGVDEISHSNFILDALQGWYKSEDDGWDWDDPPTPGTLAGEGAAAFLLSGRSTAAIAALVALATLHTEDVERVAAKMRDVVGDGKTIDLFLCGENGDSRLQPFYSRCEAQLPADLPVMRYKPGCGDYPTSTAVALWLVCRLFSGFAAPESLLKRGRPGVLKNILIYNNYKGQQHSFMLVSAAG
jgi:3-oxoacyl-[acyl-carrier-protein] synthase II